MTGLPAVEWAQRYEAEHGCPAAILVDPLAQSLLEPSLGNAPPRLLASNPEATPRSLSTKVSMPKPARCC